MEDKKKIVVVFSDVSGTYLSSKDKEEAIRKVKLKEFINNIKMIKSLLGCKLVLFSFVTDDDITVDLESSIEEFSSLKTNDIFLEKHFFMNGNFLNGKKNNNSEIKFKIFKINDYVMQLAEQYDIKKVIYIDDSSFNTNLANKFFELLNVNFDYNILLAENGLDDINLQLQGIIKNTKSSERGSI